MECTKEEVAEGQGGFKSGKGRLREERYGDDGKVGEREHNVHRSKTEVI